MPSLLPLLAGCTCGLCWFKSSYSGGEGNACLEVAHAGTRVAIRDSKAPGGPALAFPPAAFMAFIDSVRGTSADGDVR
ncbi:DUF397 domain-containing protein [Streptomyces sp. MS1.AVA.3]|uniref:DUF397 domain-containing protein n=1 Tax=Streptomyces decoyicus TaxID=249567 RepID=UPI0030C4D0D1